MANYGTILRSFNGPNHLSSQLSGRMAAYDRRSYDLRIWPNEITDDKSESLRKLYPGLRRDDGTVFVIGFMAGRSYYDSSVDDPLFSAHDRENDMYLPDYEITALGCVEQYRFCVEQRPEWCTPWGAQDEIWRMILYLIKMDMPIPHLKLGFLIPYL